MLDMNPEIRAQWCAALRSGNYPQTQGQLRRTKPGDGAEPGYCCLGVLCELAVAAGIITRYDGPQGYLPYGVATWAGLAHDGGSDPVLNGASTATALNDGGMPFTEIADLIDGGAP
jgi:hypothetical protein